MKIVAVEDLHADGGWRTLSFLKITTDEGLVGWSEFNEGFSTPGLTQAIRALGATLQGEDPRAITALWTRLYAMTRNATGGIVTQAIAAVINACLDIKAKALGIPVFDLFGGAVRERLPLYWSQCGTLRTRFPDMLGTPPLRSLDDVVSLGAAVKTSGYRALKTNVLLLNDGGLTNYRPGFGQGPGHPNLNIDRRTIEGITDLLDAFAQGAGADVRILLDLNFNFRPEAARRIAHAVERFDLFWLELDLYDPAALAMLRNSCSTPIASLESLYGRRAVRPFFEEQAIDVAIIDPQWNGLPETMAMAALADGYETNVAPHNFHGPLSTLIGAHMSAAIPNFRIMEFVVDEAPWIQSYLTHPLVIENGEMVLPLTPGWGSDINEEAVRSRPPVQK